MNPKTKEPKPEYLETMLQTLGYYRLAYLINFVRFRLARPRNLKLHLGCGKIRKEGYLNIDHRRTKATDMVCNIRKLPLPEGCAEVIESYHVIEHLPHREAGPMLEEWLRLLKPGGRLVIECPNFDRTVQEYLDGNQDRIYNIYGLQRFKGDFHLFGYNFARLSALLEESGFAEIREAEPEDYHKELEPCMRIECIKAVQ